MNRRPPILDGHVDTLQAFYTPNPAWRSFFQESECGHLDLPRAKRAGWGGGFFSIFVPTPATSSLESNTSANRSHRPSVDDFMAAVEFPYAHEMAKAGMESLFALEAESEGKLTVVRMSEEVCSALEEDRVVAIAHFEGAEAIDPGLHCLGEFYTRGLRSVGIVWSRPNCFGCGVDLRGQGSPDEGPGLTQAGEELVRACNQLGIVIDLSHLNEKGFWDVEKISSAPLVATHSSMYGLSPSRRNLTDKQLDAIRATGGVVGINFGVRFLRRDGEVIAETPLSDLVRHFTYAAERIGIDHIAIGSDFDGTTIPLEIGDVTGLPRLMEALQDNGFDEDDLAKISNKNWVRVLSTTWK